MVLSAAERVCVLMRKILKYAVIALILYLILGAILPFVRQPKISPETQAAFHPEQVYGSDYSGQRVDVISDNTEALAERIRLISHATDRIILSTFDFRSDSAGIQMLAALTDAAQRGVHVQVLVDGLAGLLRMERNPLFYALSAQPTAEVKLYSPIRPLLPWTLMGRLHDKYLVVDDTAFVLGGRNTYNFFLGEPDGWLNYDWDALVYSDTSTDGMEQVVDYFHSVWNYKESKVFHDDPALLEKPKVQEALTQLSDLYAQMQTDHPDWFTERDYQNTTLPAGKITLLHNPIHSYAKEPTCYYQMTEILAQKGSHSTIHTPYLICNKWMLSQLERIAHQNEQTVLMTNSIANNGNPFGSMDYWAHKEQILDTGVQILEYDSGVSYHGKCARMDDRLTMIGSLNFDMRSAYIDTELMLVIDSPEVNADMAQMMEQYEQECLVVTGVDSCEPPQGYTPQEIPYSKFGTMSFMRLFLGWSRFLL